MKTPEQWINNRPFGLELGWVSWIAAIQSDAREGMVTAAELRPTIEFLKQAGWVRCQCPGHWKKHAESCAYGEQIARLETLLGENQPAQKEQQ